MFDSHDHFPNYVPQGQLEAKQACSELHGLIFKVNISEEKHYRDIVLGTNWRYKI